MADEPAKSKEAANVIKLGPIATDKLGGVRVGGPPAVANTIYQRGSHSVIYANRGYVFDGVFNYFRLYLTMSAKGYVLMLLALYLFLSLPKLWIISVLVGCYGCYNLGMSKITQARYNAVRGLSAIVTATGVGK